MKRSEFVQIVNEVADSEKERISAEIRTAVDQSSDDKGVPLIVISIGITSSRALFFGFLVNGQPTKHKPPNDLGISTFFVFRRPFQPFEFIHDFIRERDCCSFHIRHVSSPF